MVGRPYRLSPPPANAWPISTSFHPDRMASRILGMGDVLKALIEQAEREVRR